MIEYCAVIWTEQESLSCDVNMSRSHCFNINNNARNDIDSVIRASKKCLCCCLSVKWLSHKRNSCASSIYENRQPIDCNTQISSALTFRRIVVALESVRDLTNKFSFNLNLKRVVPCFYNQSQNILVIAGDSVDIYLFIFSLLCRLLVSHYCSRSWQIVVIQFNILLQWGPTNNFNFDILNWV